MSLNIQILIKRLGKASTKLQLEAFLKEASSGLPELEESLNRADLVQTRQQAHKLRGVCLSVGDSASVQLLTEIQTSIDNTLELESLKQKLEAVYKLIDEDCRMAKDYLDLEGASA